jgi:pyruvate,water dikinase
MQKPKFILWFEELGIGDVQEVGGKNASLGEMYRELSSEGVKIPNGFAVTASAYFHLLESANLNATIRETLQGLKTQNVRDLALRGRSALASGPGGRDNRALSPPGERVWS